MRIWNDKLRLLLRFHDGLKQMGVSVWANGQLLAPTLVEGKEQLKIVLDKLGINGYMRFSEIPKTETFVECSSEQIVADLDAKFESGNESLLGLTVYSSSITTDEALDRIRAIQQEPRYSNTLLTHYPKN